MALDHKLLCPFCEEPMNRMDQSEFTCVNTHCPIYCAYLHPGSYEGLQKIAKRLKYLEQKVKEI